jgi:hypothetical protein
MELWNLFLLLVSSFFVLWVTSIGNFMIATGQNYALCSGVSRIFGLMMIVLGSAILLVCLGGFVYIIFNLLVFMSEMIDIFQKVA